MGFPRLVGHARVVLGALGDALAPVAVLAQLSLALLGGSRSVGPHRPPLAERGFHGDRRGVVDVLGAQ